MPRTVRSPDRKNRLGIITPKKMAMPPRRGVATAWILRASGSSIAPKRRANPATTGVKAQTTAMAMPKPRKAKATR